MVVMVGYEVALCGATLAKDYALGGFVVAEYANSLVVEE